MTILLNPSAGRRQTNTSPLTAVPTPRDQRLLHDINLSVVSRALFATKEPVSRANIAELTGMTRATVSRLTEELVEAGIVKQLEPIRTPQQGRPAHLLIPRAGTIAGIGLEVNVDLIAGRALDLAGNTLSEFSIGGEFRNSEPDRVIERLARLTVMMIEELGNSDVASAGISLAIPGVIDHQDGFLHAAPNLGWADVPLLDIVKSSFGDKVSTPVQVWNDADQQAICAAYSRPGLLRPSSTFLYIAGDYGIGGALVYDGKVDVGVHGAAGEIGHTCVDINGAECFCGSSGCLERYAGRSAILLNAGLDPDQQSMDDLIALLEDDDSQALGAATTAGNALSVAIGNAVNLLDIPRVILGTGLGRLLPWMEPSLSERTAAMVIGGSRQDLKITAGTAGPSPACTGGALISLLEPINDPAKWISRTT